MNSKITLPSAVAAAIRHYTDLADSKTEALTDILSLGYEGIHSNVILRHFDGNHDELMEALICGYQVEQTPEEKVAAYYEELRKSNPFDECTLATIDGMRDTLNLLGIKIEGVNA